MKYVALFFLLVILIFRFISTSPNFKNGQHLKISGQVETEPLYSYGNLKFSLRGIKVETKETNIQYGDLVVVEGLYKDGELINTKIDEIKSSANILLNIRKSLIGFYKDSMREPSASLVAGITIGAKSTLPRNFLNNLNKTGTSHIVVASGTNVVMLGSFIIEVLLLKLKRKKALILTITFIWLYTFIAGLEAPIIRASIMATIAFTAMIFGKVANTFKITLLTAYIMLFLVPSWINDIGFLLSFATTISLILFQARVNKIFKFLPDIVREDLSTSIAAQVGAAPIIFYFFGTLNIFSPFINILVLWMVPIIMVVGGLSGALSFILPQIAKPILLTIYPLTLWFVSVVNFFGSLL